MPITRFTPSSKKVNIYADFKKNLEISPLSNDLTLLKDEDAVKEALTNILLTEPGERLMQPDFGGGLRTLLFENLTPATLTMIRERIIAAVRIHEPRAELINVTVASTIDENAVQASIQFYISNTEQPIELDVILERTR